MHFIETTNQNIGAFLSRRWCMTYNRMLLLQTCQTFAYFLIFAFADFHHDPPLVHLSVKVEVNRSQSCSISCFTVKHWVLHVYYTGLCSCALLHLFSLNLYFIDFVFLIRRRWCKTDHRLQPNVCGQSWQHLAARSK